MKKSLIAMLMLLTLTAGNEVMAQKHRHNPNVTLNVQDPTTGNKVVSVNVNAADDDTTGIVAYSDTTSVDTTATVNNIPTSPDWDDFDFDDDDFSSALKNVLGIGVGGALGVGGVILAIILCLFVLLLFLAPIIAIVVVIWLIVRNRNQRLRLAEKAMETGQPIPQEALKTPTVSDDDLKNKGLRNLFLGLGLIACGHFIIGDVLQGIGMVLFFYGIGQTMIARSSKKKQEDVMNNEIEHTENGNK